MDWFTQRARLEGKVAVITGGAGGLGEAIAIDLAANGVRIAVIDIDRTAVEEFEGVCGARGFETIAHRGDARDPDALAALFDAADKEWGRLDILVNGVGGTFRAPFTDTAAKGWDALLRTNLTHVLHACGIAVPRIRSGGQGGSIINLTTIEAHRAAPGFAVYSAAKAAVTQFARTLAIELAPEGIRVNNIAPDYVPTLNISRLAGDNQDGLDHPEGVRVAVPMARAGRLTDVSNCAVFLASELSAFITGTTLHPDGGTYASSGWFNWPDAGWANHVPARLLET